MQLRIVKLLIVSGCMIAGIPGLMAQELLDLVKAAEERVAAGEPRSGSAGGGRVWASGMTLKPLPLVLTLRSVSPQKLSYGERLVYEVSVKNTGTDAIEFPWSPERIEPLPEVPGDTLSLVTKDDAGREWFVAVQGIYGREDAEGSIKRLEPGDEVRIRGGGIVQMGFVDRVAPLLASLPSEFNLHARLVFRSGVPSENRVPILSAESVSLELLPRTQ